MKKLGFWLFLLVFIFPLNVFAHPWNKGFSNPYYMGYYSIRDRNGGVNNNTVIFDSSNETNSSMYTLNFNATHKFNIRADITCLSNSNDNALDIGDCLALDMGESDLQYWIVPLCVNKYDFSVKINKGNCPGCFFNDSDVSILIGDPNSCSFVPDDFVGPVQYLSDPGKGTIAYLTFKVKKYNIPNTYLSASANDVFTIYNNMSDYPFVYRFLDVTNIDGGLYDRNGINDLSLRSNTPSVAVTIQDNINAPYKCQDSYNKLNISQGSYFSNDTLTLSSSTLPFVRNLNEKNIFNLNKTLGTPSNTAFSNTTKRTFNTDNYIVGLSSNNFYSNSAVSNVMISPESVSVRLQSSVHVYGVAFPFILDPNTKYTLSYDTDNIASENSGVGFYKQDGTFISFLRSTGNNNYITFTTPSDCYYTTILFTPPANTLITYTKIQLEKGNKSEYVPYKVFGFNNAINNFNYSSLKFVETNLVETGKVQYCVKFKDNWTNEFNVVCKDFISGSESSFLGLQSHMHYDISASIYNTCLYGFGYLCGDKLPYAIQFQLIDTNNSYYFTKPLLYSKNISYSKVTGKTEYGVNGDENIPKYVPPNITICSDNNTGNIYDYNTRVAVYNSSNSNDTYADEVYLQQEYNNLFGGYELPDSFGLSGLIDIPVNFVNQVRNGSCSPIQLNFKIKNRDVQGVNLPCGSSFWNRQDIINFKPFIETFFTGLIVYQIIFNLFFFVRSKRDPVKITYDDGSEGLMVL